MRWAAALAGAALLASTAGAAAAAPSGPTAAVVMDVRTRRVLYARAPHRRWPPASLTKMLTAIMALERLAPEATVSVSARAAAHHQGSAIGLEAGERWPVRDLLAAMLIGSANDAAVAVAEAVAGSQERFAAAMNARARGLGARGSRFVNPHGLSDPAHYSTAHDLALIARHALANPAFATLVRTETWDLERPGRPIQRIVNTNRLLGQYPGADGVKTGWTAASGPSLAASATREGWQLLAVVLNSPEVFGDAARLLDDAFRTFHPVRVAGRGERFAAVALGRPARRLVAIVPADVHAVVRRGEGVAARVRLRPGLRLPIAAGAAVGEVRFVAGGELVARSVLVAAHPVGR